MATIATGGGKTVLASDIIEDLNKVTLSMAHRQELVGQLSLTLNRDGVAHSLMCPAAVAREIRELHHSLHGYSLLKDDARVVVAGVDTLNARELDPTWCESVQFVVIDEGHHVTKDSKWHRARESFPNARALLLTAHAIRGDGKGLGRSADGIVDRLVVGPHARALIDSGYLCDYRLIAPPNDLNLKDVPLAENGDYNSVKLAQAVHRSKRLVGDVVGSYIKFAKGKLGITFAVDVAAAQELTAAYNAAGVPAALVTANTPTMERARLMRDFKARRLLQLVNVDLFGEGVDVPALEVVSMARPTQSFQLYSQQFGRALRLMISDELQAAWGSFTDAERLAHIAASVKPKALVIDHVSNYQLGLPDVERTYDLSRRERKGRQAADDAIPLRACLECFQPYEAVLTACPYCQAAVVPQSRRTIEAVAGDLVELDGAVLDEMRKAIRKIDGPVRMPKGLPEAAQSRIKRLHIQRQEAQCELRKSLCLYEAGNKSLGRCGREGQKRFWQRFGTDVLTAQTLGAKEALELKTRIDTHLKAMK